MRFLRDEIQILDRTTGEPVNVLLVMSHSAVAMGLPTHTYTTTDFRGRAQMTALISDSVSECLYVNEQIYRITKDSIINGGEASPVHSPHEAKYKVRIQPTKPILHEGERPVVRE